MRVTENSNYDLVRESMRRSKEKMEALQVQSSTLKRVNQPSDDPVGCAKILEIRTQKLNQNQFQMNAKFAELFLKHSEEALGELADIVGRVKELALAQASSTNTQQEVRYAVAAEVEQLQQQALAIGNRRFADRYIFAGYQTQKPPLDAQGVYQGDDGCMKLEVESGVFVPMNIPGSQVFHSSSAEKLDIFDHIQTLKTVILTGDLEAVRRTLEGFHTIQSALITNRSSLGSSLQGLQSHLQSLDKELVTQASLSSVLEDVDLAQVVSDLGKEESVFRSSLAGAKKLIEPKLLDYLK